MVPSRQRDAGGHSPYAAQFVATEQLAQEQFATTPMCAESWARWVVVDSMAFAGRSLRRAPP